MENARAALEKLIRERREDYASLSRLLGRNAAYVQQFIHRGTPRKLAEEDRRLLARYFGVDEAVLGGPPATGLSGPTTPFFAVPRFDLQASAGPGALADDEAEQGSIGFDPAWLRKLAVSPRHVSMIRVTGDSMLPTLGEGDEIMVDQSDGASLVREGVYVLRIDGALVVKRLVPDPTMRSCSVVSDNPDYPNRSDVDPAEIEIVGRVVWAGRKI